MVADVMLSLLFGFLTHTKIKFVIKTVRLLSSRKTLLMDSCILVLSCISLCAD